MKFSYIGLIVVLIIIMINVFLSDSSPSQTSGISEAQAPDTPPCDTPLLYEIGDIDIRFGIHQSDVAMAMEQVEQLWNTALDKELIKSSRDGDVMITLSFANEANKVAELSKTIAAKEKQIAENNRVHEQLLKQHEDRANAHEELLAQRNKVVREYNANIQKWSSSSAGPEEKRKETKISSKIDSLESRVHQELAAADALFRQIGASAERLNEKTDKYNSLIARYEDLLNDDRIINKGDFYGERIHVYQFDDQDDLVMVLAHEIGHALGLDHVPNDKSVMHAYIHDQDLQNRLLTSQDIQAIQDLCHEKMF
ncbi:MAG: matrixin family metalloprotease [Balneolales bacterium]